MHKVLTKLELIYENLPLLDSPCIWHWWAREQMGRELLNSFTTVDLSRRISLKASFTNLISNICRHFFFNKRNACILFLLDMHLEMKNKRLLIHYSCKTCIEIVSQAVFFPSPISSLLKKFLPHPHLNPLQTNHYTCSWILVDNLPFYLVIYFEFVFIDFVGLLRVGGNRS